MSTPATTTTGSKIQQKPQRFLQAAEVGCLQRPCLRRSGGDGTSNKFCINIGDALQRLRSAQRGTSTIRCALYFAYLALYFYTCHQPSHVSWTLVNDVFLASGCSAPAQHSRYPTPPAGNLTRNSRKERLLLAGDVESNPGPATRPGSSATNPDSAQPPTQTTCDSCEGVIRAHQIPRALKCNQLDCSEITHRNCRMNNISRYTRNPVWTCRLHRGEPQETAPSQRVLPPHRQSSAA